jgi:pentatricopeptide repeat protein
MKQVSVVPNDVTFNSLIDACVRANKMHKAWGLLKEMQESGVHPDNFTYSTLIKGIRPDALAA